MRTKCKLLNRPNEINHRKIQTQEHNTHNLVNTIDKLICTQLVKPTQDEKSMMIYKVDAGTLHKVII